MKKILTLLILVIILAGCTTHRELSQQQKMNLLRDNLSRLNNFKASGVVEVNVSAFSLKKEFSLTKSSKEVRIDIIDSGIFALSPKPFASIYVGSSVAVTDYNKGFIPERKIPFFPFQSFLDLENLPTGILEEIVMNGNFNVGPFILNFDSQYRLSEVVYGKNRALLEYDNSDEIELIKIESTKANLNMKFDSFEHGVYTIKKLNI
ncbi:MAG: hypothetical protein B6226_01425 [Candidatus Cloacimonetes bacterium 4572_65]|nr:MAG: hypothetical protein B6226_01425 [Candidatus Cloacimonetes bacterium 4572_65]